MAENEARPLHPDEIARMVNEAPKEVPRQIKEIGARRLLDLSRLDGREFKFKNIEGVPNEETKSFQLNLGEHVIPGVIGAKQDRIEARVDKVYEEAKPDTPEWAGRMFHPQVSIPEWNPILRREEGRPVKPNIVVGSDDRTVYYPYGYPWHCIGRIYVWNNASATSPAWTGSGALVGRNVVLTAAHVVPWGASSWMMKFVPAHYDGTSIYGAGFESWVSQVRGYVNTSNVTGWDMATLRLTNSVGNSLGYFGTKHYSSSWNDHPYWTHCGYAGAVSGTRPNWQNGIRVHDTDSDSPGLEVEHDADVTPGDSGGPLFAWWNEGPYIVGTHSGDETEYHFPFSFPRVNVDAGGGALNSLVRWARDHW